MSLPVVSRRNTDLVGSQTTDCFLTFNSIDPLVPYAYTCAINNEYQRHIHDHMLYEIW